MQWENADQRDFKYHKPWYIRHQTEESIKKYVPIRLKVAEFPKLALKHGILLNLPI